MGEPVVIGDQPAGRNRRMLVLAGIAIALVLAVVVLPGMLFGGGGSSSDDLDFPAASDATPTTSTTVGGDAPAETFESFSDKDPFTPLVDLASAESTAPSGTSSPTTIAPQEIVVEDTPPPTFPPEPSNDQTTTPTTVAGPPPAPARQPDRVSMLEVFTDQGGRVVGTVRVNDVTYQVAEGDEFATSYRVLDLDIGTRCAQLLFGDDRFGLCEGEEALK